MNKGTSTTNTTNTTNTTYTTNTSYTSKIAEYTATNKSTYTSKSTVSDTSVVPEDAILKIRPEETSNWYDAEAFGLPDCCKNCPNRPSKRNGYTSICMCALPALTNPITAL